MIRIPPGLENGRLTEALGLVHMGDDADGYHRRRRGSGWSYHRSDGTLVKNERERERIASLAIPPAWTDVWIARDPRAHIQATGRDERGRKQYRYHPIWEEARERRKHLRLLAFGRALPGVRRKLDCALSETGLGRDRVLAAVVTILDETGIRAGNEAYARDNGTYGVTTLRDRHTCVEGNTVDFTFEGKGGGVVQLGCRDDRVASVVEDCQAVPGYEVFKWLDESGEKHDVTSVDLNAYIREISGQDFTAKDFRTWLATAEAFGFLCDRADDAEPTDVDSDCIGAADAVAERLHNTRSVARDSYIQSEVLDAYRDTEWREFFNPSANGRRSTWLSPAESALLHLLEALDR